MYECSKRLIIVEMKCCLYHYIIIARVRALSYIVDRVC